MRIPESLATLAEYGIIEEVVRPLMSGKEAQIYLVVSGGEQRVAKIYKDAQNRSFKHRAAYTEGRKVRNTRDQRAISNHSSHGRERDEAAWRSTEVSMIYRLQSAGVRVPAPYHFIDGVLVMELITDAEGNPAPRLGGLALSGDAANAVYETLLGEVVRMLCAGVVHGDLSDFNVLMAAGGPVLIDFPQAVDAAHNQNARKLLMRDVDNLHNFLARSFRNGKRPPYAEEMWDLFESNLLTPTTSLSGRYQPKAKTSDTASVLALIDDARRDERRRREVFGFNIGPAASGGSAANAAPARNERSPKPDIRTGSRKPPDGSPRRQPAQSGGLSSSPPPLRSRTSEAVAAPIGPAPSRSRRRRRR